MIKYSSCLSYGNIAPIQKDKVRLGKLIFALLLAVFFFPDIASASGPCSTPPCPLGTTVVSNGNFSDPTNCGFSQFYSDLLFQCAPTGTNGSFSVVNDAGVLNPAAGWSGTTHTADGSMVYFGVTDGSNARAWYQSVSVTAGKAYYFSAWFSGGCPGCVPPSNPTLQLAVFNPATGGTTVIDTKTDQNWTQLCGTYNATATGTIEIRINIAGPAGQFFDLDDISFQEFTNPTARFSYEEPYECNQAYYFYSTELTTVTHSWDFGDGFTSTDPNPTHAFPGPGVFSVTHSVSSSCGTDVYTEDVSWGCCCECGKNLALNGKFAKVCQSDYSTDIPPANYQDCNAPVLNALGGANRYSETTDASLWSNNWKGLDHTPGGGTKFMIINGPVGIGNDVKVWKENVTVEDGKTYCFSAWIRTLCAFSNWPCPEKPVFQLSINGVICTTSMPLTDNGILTGWKKLCCVFPYSGATTTIEIAVILKGTATGSGNDAGLDDVYFGEQGPPDPSFIAYNTHCNEPAGFISLDESEYATHAWNFGDPASGTDNTSTDQNPTHTFVNEGTYVVSHQIQTKCGLQTITKVINVKCCCKGCKPNILTEGSFTGNCSDITTQINNGHTELTSFDCTSPPQQLIPFGAYVVTTDAQHWNPGWNGADHTGQPNSNFLAIDGLIGNGSTYLKAWYKTVSVKAGKTYCFRAWVRNICMACSQASDPDMRLVIRDPNTLVVDEITAIPYQAGWLLLCGSYTATADQDIEIAVEMLNSTFGVGNDAGLDDIYFGEDGGPDADFDFSAAHCNQAMPFTSKDRSSCAQHTWIWGDNSADDHTSDPTHVFAAGTYIVTHKVKYGINDEVVVTKEVVVTCCCTKCRPNMLQNGSFSESVCTDNTFLTDLQSTDCSTAGTLAYDHYVVTKNADGRNPFWVGLDHTTNGVSSYFIAIDGPGADGPPYPQQGSWVKAWYQQGILVKANKTYCFQAWVKNVCSTCDRTTDPAMRLMVRDGQGYSNAYSPLDSIHAIPYSAGWLKICGTFTPDQDEYIEIAVEMKVTSTAAGNDAGLDDIYFGEVGPPDAHFTYEVTNCATNGDVTVKFHPKDISEPGNFITQYWNFGDNQDGNTDEPVHIYPGPGTYTVVHTATTACGTSTVTRTIHVKCCCSTCGDEMAFNGSFSDDCHKNYYSELDYRTCDDPSQYLNPGFSETTDAANWNIGWTGTDHTNTTGSRFMIIDGASDDKVVWWQSIKVTKNESYCFSAYVKTLADFPAGEQPSFRLRIDGKILDEVLNLDEPDEWVKMCSLYDAPATGYVKLEVIMLGGTTIGDDAGLDDISFKQSCCGAAVNAKFSINPCQDKYMVCNPYDFLSTDRTLSNVHEWKVDTVVVSANIDLLGYLFTAPGSHTIVHTVTNGCKKTVETLCITVEDCITSP